MTVRLRPHHLLCMLTYVGKGYSAAFVVNYDTVVQRIGAGEAIEIVEGPDEVCGPLRGTPQAHCERPSVTRRDALAARDVGRLLKQEIVPGATLQPDAALVARLRVGFASGSLREACAGCEWFGLCSDVSSGGYAAVRLC